MPRELPRVAKCYSPEDTSRCGGPAELSVSTDLNEGLASYLPEGAFAGLFIPVSARMASIGSSSANSEFVP